MHKPQDEHRFKSQDLEVVNGMMEKNIERVVASTTPRTSQLYDVTRRVAEQDWGISELKG